VAFDSGSDDLIDDDGNFSRDAFVRDRELDTTIRVSLTSSGEERDGTSEIPVISANGKFVVFESDGKFTAGDVVDGFVDVFRRGPLF
jgi:Tol biopolymer transport system component